MLLLEAAVRYSLAASLAYLPAQSLREGKAEYSRRLAPYLTYSEQLLVPHLSASCTVFDVVSDEEGADVVVAFRGSTTLVNYRSMFNLGFVPSELGSEGNVHRGYQEASLCLFQQLEPILKKRGARRAVFVGHSFGGGTATMCALLNSRESDEDTLVTFAGPRVGDTAFASSFDRSLGTRTTHLVHDLDPVLAQNQPLWNALGFVHTGKLVRCSHAEPRFLCDNERTFGLPLNFADHANYLGTYIGPRKG